MTSELFVVDVEVEEVESRALSIMVANPVTANVGP
jgi:hypothetical protein